MSGCSTAEEIRRLVHSTIIRCEGGCNAEKIAPTFGINGLQSMNSNATYIALAITSLTMIRLGEN